MIASMAIPDARTSANQCCLVWNTTCSPLSIRGSDLSMPYSLSVHLPFSTAATAYGRTAAASIVVRASRRRVTLMARLSRRSSASRLCARGPRSTRERPSRRTTDAVARLRHVDRSREPIVGFVRFQGQVLWIDSGGEDVRARLGEVGRPRTHAQSVSSGQHRFRVGAA